MALHITSVEPHPTNTGKLRVKFSEPINLENLGTDPVADADTVALWKADESSGSSLLDATGTYNLALGGSFQRVAGLRGNAIRLHSGLSNGFHAADAAFRNAAFGEWTWEAFVKPVSMVNNSWNCIFAIDGANPDNDMMLRLHMNGGADYPGQKVFHVQWRGAGTYQNPMGAVDIGWTFNAWNGIAVKKISAGGGLYKVQMFLNGVRVFDGTPVGNCVAASSQGIFLGSGSANQWPLGDCHFDSVRFSDIARPDQEISDYHFNHQPGFSTSSITVNGGVTVVGVGFAPNSTDTLDVTCTGLEKGVVYTVTAVGITDVATSTAITSPGNDFKFGYFGTNSFDPSVDSFSGFFLTTQRTFPGDLEINSGGSAPSTEEPLGWSVSLVGGKVKVQFDDDILDTPVLRNTSNYLITEPIGSPPVTVTSVEVFTDYVLLNLSVAETANGENYSLTVLLNTARAADDGSGNAEDTESFVGVGVVPVVSKVRSFATENGNGAIRVTYSKAMNMSPTASASARNVLNYNISGGLAISSIVQVDDRTVDLLTGPQARVTYTLTITGVADIYGNEVA